MLPKLTENKRLKLALIIIVVNLHRPCIGQQSCVKTYTDTEAEKFCANKGTQCNSNADCKAVSKTCNCDGKCGKTCFNLQLTCPDELSITNGQIAYTNSQTYGSVATFTCNAAYLLNQTTNTRTCLANKKWNGNSPTCTGGCGTPSTNVHNAYIAMFDPAYPVGESFNFKCNFGSVVEGNPHSECLATLKWSVPNFSCVATKCKILSLNNGKIVRTTLTIPENEYASEVEYVCDKGYVLKGSKTNQCLEDWRYPAPTCNLVSCPQPPKTIENGVITRERSSYTYLDEVSYECNSNLYSLVGQKAKCDHEVNSPDGKWVNLPKCQVNPNCTFEALGNKKNCAYTAVSWKTKVLIGANTLPGYSISPDKAVSSATLTSPNVKLTSLEHCLQFNYYASDSPDDLKVKVTSSDDKTSTFNLPSNLAVNMWHDIQFTLTPASTQTTAVSADAWNSTLQWKFIVSNIQSIMYIDDISLLSKACPNPTPSSAPTTEATTVTTTSTTTTTQSSSLLTKDVSNGNVNVDGKSVVTKDVTTGIGNVDGRNNGPDITTARIPKSNKVSSNLYKNPRKSQEIHANLQSIKPSSNNIKGVEKMTPLKHVQEQRVLTDSFPAEINEDISEVDNNLDENYKKLSREQNPFTTGATKQTQTSSSTTITSSTTVTHEPAYNGVGTGGIIGIVLSAVVLIIITVVIYCMCCREEKYTCGSVEK